MKTRMCDECQRSSFLIIGDKTKLVCQSGHKPKFFAPRFEGDRIYGWKRKCGDYIAREGIHDEHR